MSNKIQTAVSYFEMAVNEKGNDQAMLCHDEFALTIAIGLGAHMSGGFVDYGSDDSNQKIGLPKLLEHLSKNKVDYVIIPYLSMLSADEKKSEELMEEIEKTGARVISISLCNEPGYEDLSDLLDCAVFEAYFTADEQR